MKTSHQKIDFMKPVNIIVAVDEHGGFGKEGKIPWHFRDDFKHFQQITEKASCIMGRRTYEDMFEMRISRKKNKDTNLVKFEEILPGRESFVISSKMKDASGAQVVPRLRTAVELSTRKNIFILGGERLFSEALVWTQKIYMTIVKGDYKCDRFFPIDYVQRHFKIQTATEHDKNLLFITYVRK